MNKIIIPAGSTLKELQELQKEVKARIAEFRPYRIKSRLTTCTSENCDCRSGGWLHGPYLHVTYREGGKTKKVGLGPQYELHEIKENVPDKPDIQAYFRVANHQYKEMTVAEARNYTSYVLSDREFFERHGVTKDENRMGLASKYWATREDRDRYEQALELWYQERELPCNPWAKYGVGTLRGVAVLEQLERQKYYLKR